MDGFVRLQANAFDVDERRELVPEDALAEEMDRPQGAHGEPGTIAVLAITPLVIQAVSLWLLKQRRKKTVKVHAEKVAADGARESITMEVQLSESTSVPEVVEQVVNGLNLDPSLIE